MAAGIYNFTIEQGATFTRIFKYKDSNGDPIDLSEGVLNMQIRETVGSADPVIGGTFGLGSGFTISIPTGESTKNQFSLIIPASSSSLYSFTSAVYDIELVQGGETTRLLQGKIKISKEVNR